MSVNERQRKTSCNTIFQNLLWGVGHCGTNWPTEVVEIATLYEFDENDRFFTISCDPYTKLGIGIEETNAGIGIPASMISVRYRNKKMPDCISLVQYWIDSGTVSFFHSGTGLTGCRTVRHFEMYFKIFIKKTKIHHQEHTKRRLETL
jgi:hypothetical protein